MSEFRMPSLGAAMEAGTLIEWLRQPGQAVARGDIIAVVDTEKGAIEIEVFEDGVVETLLVQPGTKVPVGTPLAVIRAAGAAAPAHAPAPAMPAPAAAPAPAPLAPPLEAPPAAPADRRRASPAARVLARSLGVDLAGVTGTGPGGAVTRDDVERAAAAKGPAPPADRAAAMRRAIAAAMTQSKREIPHYYLATSVDMTPALAWLTADNAARPVTERMLPVVLLIKAVGLALTEVPELNGHWIDSAFRPGTGIHVGMAISLRGGGLVAPAIHDVDRRPLPAIMTDLRDLVARARAGGLKSSELADPTITLTNLGDLGVELALGIIHPPQVALVSAGRPVERPWAVDGAVAVRSIVTLGLSVDHRVVDGHRAGLFLAAVERRLQQPAAL
jgi:pyruvate dehydrogenase E2 component (dihydrolipoamide acetyltransferase)